MKIKSYLTKKEKRAVTFLKKELIKSFPEDVLELRLFGSKARGDYHKESDVDILVVISSLNDDKKDRIYDAVLDILHKYGVYLSVHIYSQEEFNSLNLIPTVFMQLVQRDAVSL